MSQEIESYNKQLSELELKDSVAQPDGAQGASSLAKANNALKSAIHQQLLVRERERFTLQRKLEETRKEAEEMAESASIYASVTAERRKNLVNKYLNSH